MQQRTLLTIAAIVGLATALPAAAQFQKPEQAVKYRQSAMSLQGSHMGRLMAMANGRVPFDAKAAADNIEIIAVLNRLQFSAFVDGTDKVGNTRAKAEVWTEKEKFAAAVAKSQEEVAKLLVAGRSGNLDQIKAAAGAVGQTCKSCHDAFQAN
jgi:cytochrome c556